MTHTISVEVDDATLRHLSTMGNPAEVLAGIAHVHAERRVLLGIARKFTVQEAMCEQCQADTALEQRDAKAQWLSTTLRAEELRGEADAAKTRAEKSASELRVVAEFRERFIGILAHDLRNPVGSIGTSAALLLRRGRLNAQDAETAARIVRGGQRMTRMIAQLLDLTRARLGDGLAIEPGPTDLSEVFRDVIEELDAVITWEMNPELTGTWDQDRLAEALSNLVGNAVAYSAPGTAVVIRAQTDGTHGVVIEVENHGEPIPDELLPFIFEPFRQGQQGSKSASGNLGLGLYIAHQIVLAHHGTLEARSFGGRTTFTIHLPLHAV